MEGRDVVIAGAVRTPIGRGHREKGYYRDIHPATLLGATYSELLGGAGVDPAAVELTIAGCVQQFGEQSLNIARTAWLQEGLPQETSATTIDVQCGSGQQAVAFGAAMIAAGAHDVVIGGGVEHMGRIPLAATGVVEEQFGQAFTPQLLERYPIENQGVGAELIAVEYGIDRRQMDELAVRSHALADAATKAGAFRREMVAIEGHETDQGIRPGTDLETLAALRPAFRPDGLITAGNSSQVSDGAAGVLLTSAAKAAELGLPVRARIRDQLTVGCDPVKMLEGPIPATNAILARNGMSIADIDRIEINEAFAPVLGAWLKELRADIDRVNVRGGAMALGHPLGSTGARLLTTLLHTLEDDDLERGLVTMCCGGGIGTATIIERV